MSDTRPNVLFLLSDQHSYRFLSYLDPETVGEPVRTPTLDDLAQSAAVFDQAYCPMPLCTPSRICLLTGREVRECGGWVNSHEGNMTIDPSLTTLPDVFSSAGYETCLVGKMHLDGDRQFVGFDHRPYGDITGGLGHQPDPPTRDGNAGFYPSSRRFSDAGVSGIPESQLQENVVSRETIAFLREHDFHDPDRPWFLCASFSRPHFPHTAPSRYFERYWPENTPPPKVGREGDTTDHPLTIEKTDEFGFDELGERELMRARAGYFASVEYLDDVIGDLLTILDAEGLLDDTIIVYTSDHGELAGEHGLWWKQSWHEASTRIPMMVQLPEHRTGERAPARISTPVNLMDLYPTLGELAGLEYPSDVDGVDVSESVRTGNEPDRGPVFVDYLHPRWGEENEFRVVRDGRYKYVRFRGSPDLFFDVEDDPFEQNNLINSSSGDHEHALRELRRIVEETIDFDAVAEQRTRDIAENVDDRSGVPSGSSGNAYFLPDGRVVDADSPLYKPDLLTSDPEAAFADFPTENEEQ